MSSARTRTRVVVSGWVQGVWFRETCRRRAEAFDLAGWVRNNPDGSVEAVFEGDAAAVRQMVEWCEVGPSRAAVERCEAFPEAATGERGFRVR